MKNNVIGALPGRNCFGCGTCTGVCPEEALHMELDRQGFFRPHLRPGACTNCGMCVDACPALNTPSVEGRGRDFVFGVYTGIFGGWACDEQLRRSGSSGGVIRAVAGELLAGEQITGLVAIGPTLNSVSRPRVRVFTDVEELERLPRSTYRPTELSDALRFLKGAEGKYLVVGLPCQIAGMRNAQRFLHSETILFELFCGRMISQLLTDGYRKLRTGRDAGGVNVEYRDSRTGWFEFSLTLSDVGSGNILSTERFNQSTFGFLMNHRYFSQSSCLTCPYGHAGVGDVTLGDLWLRRYANQSEGASLILARSCIGNEILQVASGLHLFPLELQDLRLAQSHLVRNERLTRLPWFVPLLRKHRMVNYAVLQLYRLTGSLGLSFAVCRFDCWIMDSLRKLIAPFWRRIRNR